MSRRSLALGLVLAGAAGLACGDARAEVSSWLAFGSGATVQMAQGASSRTVAGTLTYSLGVGTTPQAPFVVGVLYRGTTMVGLGTDVGASARVCTGGFARGNWGLALDAGVAWRAWGNGAFGDSPVQAVLTMGAPWGLQLALGTELWSLDGAVPAQGFFAALEIDLLRLTLMRTGPTEHWWPNPNPPGRPDKQTASILSW